MKILKIVMFMIILIMSVGAVCAADNLSEDIAIDDSSDDLSTAWDDVVVDDGSDTLSAVQEDIYAVGEGSFSDLANEINNATSNSIDLNRNYKFNNCSDEDIGIIISKDNFAINGNGMVLDGNNQSRIFIINGTNITINNLTFLNANNNKGSAMIIQPDCSVTTNNVIFENNYADSGVVYIAWGSYFSNGDKFIDSTSAGTGVINVFSGLLKVNNALMMSSKELSWGFIQTNDHSPITVINSIFTNTTSRYTAAIRAGGNTTIRNTKFINLESLITAGAIGIKEIDELIIDNCTFINVTSDKNGGAIFTDVIGYTHSNIGEVLINRTTFVNCSSGCGGAILHLGGNLTIINSNFTDNNAVYDGGAVYTSNANVFIFNSTFNGNVALYDEYRGSYGGAIFCDLGLLDINLSKFGDNSANTGATIYLYDSDYSILNTEFKGNINFEGCYDDIFSVFDGNISILYKNNYTGENSVSLDNIDYATIYTYEGTKLVLINNTIDVSRIPSKFDLRDWNWVTSVKNQGHMGSCWSFGSSGAMESAILRYLGIEMDISENNMQDLSLVYNKYGIEGMTESNSMEAPSNYILSWLGVFDEKVDVYDELGKISPIFATGQNIHFQDVVIIPPRKNATDNIALKEAILKYGGLYINYYAEGSSVDQYYNGTPQINHGVTLIGWDDNREIAGAPDKGAWIIKNSWGTNVGENGFMYISYYDTSLSTVTNSYAYLLENTVSYNKNYQYDIDGHFIFNGMTEYRNFFLAVDDDLIAGVGTYFNDTNVEYTVEIYVNDVLQLVQSGLSPFAGFHTIKLDTYIPIKKDDGFLVKIKSNAVPILTLSRQHYINGSSQVLFDGVWYNASEQDFTCCIKVFTVEDDTKVINNNDIAIDYDGGSYFSVKVVTGDGHAVGAGEKVTFKIKDRTVIATTDNDGIAKIKITEIPNTYEITTSYNGKTYENKVTVKLNLDTCKVTANKDIKVDYAGGKYFSVKVVSSDGKLAGADAIVKFTINGKTTTVKADKNGIAKIKITDLPNKYKIKTTFNGKTYINTVTVKHVLKTSKVTVKKTAKSFTLKATLKINGKLVKGKTITFKFNGKNYKAKTNSKGIAHKTLNKKVIKKLKKGKTYKVYVTYGKDTIKSTVKVK